MRIHNTSPSSSQGNLGDINPSNFQQVLQSVNEWMYWIKKDTQDANWKDLRKEIPDAIARLDNLRKLTYKDPKSNADITASVRAQLDAAKQALQQMTSTEIDTRDTAHLGPQAQVAHNAIQQVIYQLNLVMPPPGTTGRPC